ncbi:hypothetical protein CSC81_18400, partial [Tenacibaculum discolor]
TDTVARDALGLSRGDRYQTRWWWVPDVGGGGSVGHAGVMMGAARGRGTDIADGNGGALSGARLSAVG